MTTTDDKEFAWALQHNRDVVAAAGRSPWPEILAKFSTVEAWHEHCRATRQPDPDSKLIKAILRLMSSAPGRPWGTLRQPERATLLADRLLATYWSSVVRAGDEALRDERQRIGRRNLELPQPEERYMRAPGLNDAAVRLMLPIWRTWGQVLIDSGLDDLDGMFVPPDM